MEEKAKVDQRRLTKSPSKIESTYLSKENCLSQLKKETLDLGPPQASLSGYKSVSAHLC